MALLHDYNSSNQVVSSALDTYLTKAQIGTKNGSPVYEQHRVTSKQWKWVGMDEATARSCARLTRDKYNRTLMRYYDSAGNANPSTYSLSAATVKTNHVDAGMWEVSVDLQENQMQYTVGTMDATPMWDTSCDYDEGTLGGVFLRITNANRIDGATVADNKVEIRYEAVANGFAETSNDFHIETASNASASSWTDIKSLWTTHGPGYARFAAANVQGYIRLRWKDVPSAAVANPSRSYSRTVTIIQVQAGATWELIYTADFPNYDASLVRVHERTQGATTWNNITATSAIAETVVRTSITASGAHEFMIQYDGVNSPIAYTPYDPAYDTGDGTIVVTGATWGFASQPNNGAAHIVTDYAADQVTIKCSDDGHEWSNLSASITSAGTSGVLMASYTLPTLVGAKKYFKLYHGSTQGSNAFFMPYNENDALKIRGVISESADVVIQYGQNISGFDYTSTDFKAQMSLDNGVTWTDLTRTVAGTNEYLLYLTALPGGITDVTPRLFRLSYGSELSAVVKYPLA